MTLKIAFFCYWFDASLRYYRGIPNSRVNDAVGEVLEQQQVEQYREQGFIAPVDVIPEDQAA